MFTQHICICVEETPSVVLMEYLWVEIYGAEAAKFVDILKEKLEGDEL